MILIYRFFYFFLKNLVIVLAPFLSKKNQVWIKLRNSDYTKKNYFSNTYWFHASSGEIEYCKSVIRLLHEQKPEVSIVVTYSSPSAEKLFYNITEFVDQFIPLPWDEPALINNLIDYLKPKVLIFSKTDLWPELIYQAQKRKIKMGVIAHKSRAGVSHLLTLPLLQKMTFISCQDEVTKSELLTEGLKNISADGDTRFDQVFHRLQQPSRLNIIKNSKVFICGSTWPEDEAVLFLFFNELKKQNYKIILSPHEVGNSNTERIKNELNKLNLSFQTLSDSPDIHKIDFQSDVLIIDCIGFLADAYRFADLAFIGGSFKEKIHSVMEALCCGLPVLTGPFFKNNLEAVRYHGRFVFSATSSADALSQLKKAVLIDSEEIRTEMKKNKKASEKVALFLANSV